MTRVTIAIPVYNGEEYLEQAIQSAVVQRFDDLEVLISDNASTDSTESICRVFAERYPLITYRRNPENIGAAPNYNKLYLQASGKYLKWLAHDDWVGPDYIQLCADALDRHPDAVLAHGVTQCVDTKGLPIPKIGVELGALEEDAPSERFARVIHSPLPCFEIFGLMRRDALSATELHRSYPGSDRALLAELALVGKFVPVPGAMLFNRDHRKRYIRMVDVGERTRWQDPRSSLKSSMKHWNLLTHYTRVAFRHTSGMERLRCTYHIARWVKKRNQLLELPLDLLSLVSPFAAMRVREEAWDLWSSLRSWVPAKSRTPMQ